jgi:hypothetical protein
MEWSLDQAYGTFPQIEAEEHGGTGGRKLLHAARLLRGRDTYVQRYGQAAYDLMLGDCLWHVYGMIGKLARRIYLLSQPSPRSM